RARPRGSAGALRPGALQAGLERGIRARRRPGWGRRGDGGSTMSASAALHRPSRIAFLSEHASPLALLGGQDAGGQNVYVDEVSRNLGKLGVAVDVFTRSDDPSLPTVVQWAPGVRIINLRAGQQRFIPKDDLWPLMPLFRDALLAFVAADGAAYDALHGNFWMSGWVATEARRLLGIPAVQIFHAMGKTKARHQGAADTSPSERITVERSIVRAVDALI